MPKKVKDRKRHEVALQNFNNAVRHYEALDPASPDYKKEAEFWEDRALFWSEICDQCEVNGLSPDCVMNNIVTLAIFGVSFGAHMAGHTLQTREFHWRTLSLPKFFTRNRQKKLPKK